ncbi:hypothetical protein ACEWPM_015730 [Roseovarius sp. S4756]|uniref:hypothetical protein n=1 Tax=Roseovarius maritimus TaxID=3342637 RepID=UPI0037292C4A
MIEFRCNPDLVGFVRGDGVDVAVTYCGVRVFDTKAAAHTSEADFNHDLYAQLLEDYINGLSAHERLELIGKFLAARHGDQ